MNTAQPAARRTARRNRILATVISVAGHGAVGLAMLLSFPKPAPSLVEPEPVEVALFDVKDLAPTPAPVGEKHDDPKPPAKTAPTPTKPAPAKVTVRKVAFVRPTPVKPVVAGDRGEDKGPTLSALSDADVAGAATAEGSGGGGGGGTCNMVAHLQRALRKDAVVQAAAARAHRAAGANGRALLVWNGDWLRDPAEDGHGLAGVREAIMVEVAFAPAACRAQPMRGLVLVSLDDAPGSARLALGSGAWRWSDLLTPRGGVAGH